LPFIYPQFYQQVNNHEANKKLTVSLNLWYHRRTIPIPGKERHISDTNFRVNEEIRAPEVRLIGQNGENLGIVPLRKALQIAREAELDLVEVSPTAEPPVCRVMDFGKFIYERTKKEREARRAQTKIEVKEIQLRPKTNEHHRKFKIEDARRWLQQGHKVRVKIRFRGREIEYPELALEDLKEVALELADVSTVEQPPQFEGKTMTVVLAPLKPGAKKKAPEKKAETSPTEVS
jgi:translation initiation factor IF-3